MEKSGKSLAMTTDTSLEMVEVLRELDGATMEEISESMGLAISTVHRHLAALQKHNFVVKNGTDYRLGLQFLTLGGHVQRDVKAFPKIKEKVDILANETGERAQFIVEENGDRVYLYTEVGESAVQTGANVGRRGPIHTSAAGKAILANYPKQRVQEIIEHADLTQGGPNSISSADELFEELEHVSVQGYAFNRQETTEGVNAVGAAVIDEEQNVLGALSVSGPASRVRADVLKTEFLDYVLGATNELELHIAHSF